MTGKQLKNSILQLAIQGKLVPQDPHDEPASELLKRIRKEKEQLVKTGKLKKKDLESTPIAEDEKPFEIPESWEWCRLGEILSKLTDGSHNPPPNSGSGYPVISAMNVKNGEITFDNVQRFVTESDFQKENSRTNITRGDIIMGIIGGSIGNIAIYTHDVKVIAQRSIAIMKSLIDLKYTVFYLQSSFCQNQLTGNSSGSAQGGVYLGTLGKLLIPLPPLTEQHRIVEKIEELMPLVEEYDKAQSELDKLNESLPEQLKKSILQQAIMGKLVPQDPNDEPASELLKRIHKEKESLVKSGALKKKDLITTPISDDEKPFDIPESWEWVRLADLFNIVSARRVHQKDWRSNGVPFYRTREIGWLAENKDVQTELFIDESLYAELSKTGCPKVNDIMMTAVGTIGKTYVVKEDDKFYYKDASVLCFENFSKVCPQFFCYLFSSSYFKEMASEEAMGTTVATITMVRANKYIIPLPPLSEQHRIVAKIEELFSILK